MLAQIFMKSSLFIDPLNSGTHNGALGSLKPWPAVFDNNKMFLGKASENFLKTLPSYFFSKTRRKSILFVSPIFLFHSKTRKFRFDKKSGSVFTLFKNKSINLQGGADSTKLLQIVKERQRFVEPVIHYIRRKQGTREFLWKIIYKISELQVVAWLHRIGPKVPSSFDL